jgi:uncharacterized protein DUF3108
VIAGAWLPVPEAPGPPRRLEARLAAVAPAPAPAREAAPAPPHREKRAVSKKAAPSAGDLSPAFPKGAARSAGGLDPASPEPQREPEAAEPVPSDPPQRLALAAESSAVAAAAVRTLPRRGRIAYNVLYGNDRFSVARVVQSWEVEADAYKLASEAETSGIVDLFRPQRVRYMSQGRIVPEGLRPDSFLVSRTRRGQNEASQARFDWGAGQVTYGPATDQKHAPLPPGAQDLMSVMYHFSLAPPAPGRHRLPIATGSRFQVYDIEVAGEESIDTPIGALKALPVKQVARAGSESIEFWLATEYRYLPVKIRHYDRDGNFSGEQVVSEIRISED